MANPGFYYIYIFIYLFIYLFIFLGGGGEGSNKCIHTSGGGYMIPQVPAKGGGGDGWSAASSLSGVWSKAPAAFQFKAIWYTKNHTIQM